MREDDPRLNAALAAEERDLLRRIGEGPGLPAQLGAVMGGPDGWVGQVMMAAQLVLFVAGAWMAWTFFQTTETLEALRWGLPSAVLLIMSLMIKLAMWPAMHAHRVLAAIKRLEIAAARREA